MTTRREALLVHLFEVLKTVPDVRSTWRNKAALPNDERPAVYLLDGDETNANPDLGTNRGRGPSPAHPYLLHLLPQIHIALDDRTVENNTTVGPDLNKLLEEIQYRITHDDELRELVTANGDIVYLGLQSDLGVGRTMLGQYQINWRLQYPANMDQLSI